uniref:Uncharacterized protein n=1 Tax=Streptomyces sp. NBC_01393 TaxID=2903851 RepID=A0AAU3ICX9_9ACTN
MLRLTALRIPPPREPHFVGSPRLWWGQYVPLLHVVCVNGLPMTAAADKITSSSSPTGGS